MLTVHEVSELTGVSVRALQYYDKIGLLPASRRSQAEYRLYDGEALGRLQEILLLRELEFSLSEIADIVSRPDYDRKCALDQQIQLLILKHERLERLIAFAREIRTTGVSSMSFSAFDQKKIDSYKKQAKEKWGQTDAYREYEEKKGKRSDIVENALAASMMNIFTEFGAIKELSPESSEARQLVKKLQDFISEHFYTCTPEILASLSQMYTAGGEMTENIDKAGGAGTAAFVERAISAALAG